MVSTHWSSQKLSPEAHRQLPSEQVLPPTHASPHSPQWALLSSSETHSPSQASSSPLHSDTVPPAPVVLVAVAVLPPPVVVSVPLLAPPTEPSEPPVLFVPWLVAFPVVSLVAPPKPDPPEPSVVELVTPPAPASSSTLVNSGATQAPASSVAATTLLTHTLVAKGVGVLGFICTRSVRSCLEALRGRGRHRHSQQRFRRSKGRR